MSACCKVLHSSPKVGLHWINRDFSLLLQTAKKHELVIRFNYPKFYISTRLLEHTKQSSYRPISRIYAKQSFSIQTKLLRRYPSISESNCDKFVSMFSYPNMLQISKIPNYLFTRFISTSTSCNTSKGHSSDMSDAPKLDPDCIKSIVVNACGELYKELREIKPNLYAKAPAGSGIDFKIQYYDSFDSIERPTNKLTTPTVCILHGSPGNFEEFSSLICHLRNKKIRVIAPNFPDFSYTNNYSYRHSPEERVDLLFEFFKAIKLNNIDMVIAHSSGVYTAFKLLEHCFKPKDVSSRIELRSLGLLSTPTYNLPANLAVTPLRLFTLKLFDYPILRPFMRATIDIFVRLQGIKNRVDKDNIEELLISGSAIGYSDCETTRITLELIRQEKFPVFLTYGLNDRLLPASSFDQLKRDLCIDDEKQVRRYDKSGNLVEDADKIHELVEVSEFASGGHYAFQRFTNQLNEDIYNFLKRKVLSVREITRL